MTQRIAREIKDIGEVDSLLIITADGDKLERSSSFHSSELYVFGKSDFASSKLNSSPSEGSPVISDIQSKCVAALKLHVLSRNASFRTAVNTFCSTAVALLDRCESTASSLPLDFEKLQSVPLHETLITESRKTLFDAVPHARLSEFQTYVINQTLELRRKLDDFKDQAAKLSAEAAEVVDVVLLGANLNAVRKCELSGVLLEEALGRAKRNLSQISHVSKMQEAYEKSLLEISRRKRFKQRYLAKLESVRSECEAMRAEEDERRRRFSSKYGVHLPVDLITGLSDSVAPVIVGLTGDFDKSLPDVSSSGVTANDSLFLSTSFASTYEIVSFCFFNGSTKSPHCSWKKERVI